MKKLENITKVKLNYESLVKKSSFDVKNSSFSRAVMYVAYTGKNRNGSFISKEVFENCIDTIKNVPVVCHYIREEKDYGGHDVEIIRDEDTKELRMINMTHPIGVIPSDANYWWEYVEEDDGSTKEYLCVDVLLWKREEGYTKINEDDFVHESMEIAVKSGESVNDTYYINDFEFTALCLLGDNVEPCYESASLQMYSLDEFKSELSQMFEDYKNELYVLEQTATKSENNAKGGDFYMNQEIKNVFEKYGFNPDELKEKVDFENMSVEEVDEKLSELRCTLNSQIEEQLRYALNDEKYVETWCDESYEVNRYIYFDYDAEVSEAYFFDLQDDCNIYGFTYSFDGDVVVIEKDSRKRKKCVLADFDEGSKAQNFNYFEGTKEVFTKVCDKLNETITGLQEFKNKTLEEERQSELNTLFEKFSILNGQKAFEELKMNNSGMSLEEIEDKCYSIKGRMEFSFSRKEEPIVNKYSINKDVSVPAAASKEDEPYGGLFRKFGVVKD